jgi:hypothetical protein
VAEGDDGRVLLKCFAGCPVEQIVEALGLTLADLFPPKARGFGRNGEAEAAPPRPPRPPAKTYATFREAVEALDAGLARDGARRAGRWSYRDAAGNRVAAVVRYDVPAPGGEKTAKTFRPLSKHAGGWRVGDPPGPWPLFRLDALAGAARAYVAEGERCADALTDIGLTATTSAHGAKSPGKTDWSPLAGKEVVVLPDNDEPGRTYARDVATLLARLDPPADVKVVDLDWPGRQEHDDVVDWVDHRRAGGADDGQLARDLEALADAAPAATTPAPAPDPGGEVEAGAGADVGDARKKKSPATELVELVAAAGAELFHDPDGDGYVTLPDAGHRATARLRSRTFRDWLCREFYTARGKVPGAQAVADALNVLSGQAAHEGPQHPVHVRVAGHGGKVYLDLGDAAWRAAEVDADGWRVVERPPVKFRRARAMLALPEPEQGGSVDELRPFVNVADADWPLVLAWVVAALRPRGPFPVLCLFGEQGSAKSTTARVLRSLVDPNTAPVRAEPRAARDLAIAANNGWAVCMDNVSWLPPWLSDALCRLSTGGGFATRTLYENDEESIFNAQRAVILNGIEEVATRPDLLDRSLLVCLPTIPDDRRRTEAGLWARFERARPRVLGALLDAVSHGLRHINGVRLAVMPRMADFARWAVACEPALGLPAGAFLAAYEGNRAAANTTALESSLVVKPLLRLADEGDWEGPAGELLARLADRAPEADARGKSWPKTPKALSGVLRRLAPNLRHAGVGVEFTGIYSRKGKLIRVTKLISSDGSAGPPLRPLHRCGPSDSAGKTPDSGAAVQRCATVSNGGPAAEGPRDGGPGAQRPLHTVADRCEPPPENHGKNRTPQRCNGSNGENTSPPNGPKSPPAAGGHPRESHSKPPLRPLRPSRRPSPASPAPRAGLDQARAQELVRLAYPRPEKPGRPGGRGGKRPRPKKQPPPPTEPGDDGEAQPVKESW